MKLKAAAFAIGAMGLLNCASPEGIFLDRPADGRIDEAERAAIVHSSYAWEMPQQGNDMLIGLWNDFRVSRKVWLAKKGIDVGQEGLHLRLYETADEAARRHKQIDGNTQPNFFLENNRTIYTFSQYAMTLWSFMLHEAGHDMSLSENSAEANRLHGSIYTLSIDPAAGTMLMMKDAKGYLSPIFGFYLPEEGENFSDLGEYQKAILLMLNKSKEAEGDLDLGLAEIKDGDPTDLGAYLESIYEPAMNGRQIFYEAFQSLLGSQGFLDYLNSLVINRGGSLEEGVQLWKYLQIGLEDYFAVLGSDSAKQRRLELMMELSDDMTNTSHYPDMKNRIATVVGDSYIEEAKTATQESKVGLYRRVLDLYSHLPCTFDEWACTDQYSVLNHKHLDAFKGEVDAQGIIGEYAPAVSTVNEFLQKFYPTEDYSREDTKDALFHMLRMGILNAKRQASQTTAIEQEQWYCVARDFAEIYDGVACYSQSDPNSCMEQHPYSWEQEQIDRAEELSDLRTRCP